MVLYTHGQRQYRHHQTRHHLAGELKMKKKCDMFTTANDTGKYALCVDGFVGLYDSFKDAEAALQPVADVHWDESGYGAMQIIPPNTRAVHYKFDGTNDTFDATTCLISEIQTIDIAGYISKHAARQYHKFTTKQSEQKPLAERFEEYLRNQDIDITKLNLLDQDIWDNKYADRAARAIKQ